MATSITATPQPATASVLLEVTTDPPDVVFDEDAADVTWATESATVTPDGTAALVEADAGPGEWGAAKVALSGLTVGRRYQATIDYEAGPAWELTVLGQLTRAVAGGSGPASVTVEWTAPLTSAQLWVVLPAGLSLLVAHVAVVELPEDWAFTLTRQDANGLAAVRLFEGQAPVGGGLVVVDYEPALTGPVTYTVTTDETASDTTTLDLPETWLSVPVAPQHSVRLDMVTGYEEDSPSRSTVHEIIAAEYPSFTLRPLGRRRGRLELWCPDYAAAAAVRALYRRGEVVLLRQADHPGLDLYHVATGRVRIAPHDLPRKPRRWRVEVDYHEAPTPTDPLTGALGWDMAADYERNPTLAESFAEWPTLADRYVGPS